MYLPCLPEAYQYSVQQLGEMFEVLGIIFPDAFELVQLIHARGYPSFLAAILCHQPGHDHGVGVIRVPHFLHCCQCVAFQAAVQSHHFLVVRHGDVFPYILHKVSVPTFKFLPVS